MYRSRDIYVYVMYYVYVTPGPSLLIESTDSMIIVLLVIHHAGINSNDGIVAAMKLSNHLTLL